MLSRLIAFLESFAPPALAEEWDNVGLLVGSREQEVSRVMTCLTISPNVVEEAIREKANLIVAHHPLPFRPLKRITDDTPEGRMLWQLIGAGVAIYSPHTAFDSAREGINQRLAEGLRLTNVAPLVPKPARSNIDDCLAAVPQARLAAAESLLETDVGGGRYGVYWEAISLAKLAELAKEFLHIDRVQIVGDSATPLKRVAVACGSAGEFLSVARELGCEALVTGETRFHTCLEAESTGIALVLVGHYASERFGVERLAEVLSSQFPSLTIWPSAAERDPLKWA